MERRSDDFIAKLEATDTGKVYFQPPSSVKLVYPCWVIERITASQPRADDKTYFFRPGYKCIHMDRIEPDPDFLYGVISDLFPHSVYQNHYTMDNIHHDQYLIYY